MCGATSPLSIDRCSSSVAPIRRELTNKFVGDKILDLESDFRKLGSVAMLRSLIRILRASLVQIDAEMAEKYAEQQHSAVCGKFALEDMRQDVCINGPRDLDLLTMKLVC